MNMVLFHLHNGDLAITGWGLYLLTVLAIALAHHRHVQKEQS